MPVRSLLRMSILMIVAGLALVMAACSDLAAGPAGASTAPASAALAPTAPAANPSGTSAIRLTLTPDGSEARYRAREVLAGQTLPNDAVGSTRQVTGTIVLGPDGTVVDQSKISVDLRGLKSDQSMRDGFLQRSTLNTAEFPTAEFVPAEAKGLPWPLPTTGEATFQLIGTLTVRGVTKPATWEVTAAFAPQEVTGRATTSFTMADFDIPKPSVPRVASIEDQLRLEIDFTAARTAA